MAAKIKDKNPYASNIHRHKPRGVKDKEFEKVYWPFLPIVLAATLILGLSVHSGSLASYLKHPTGKVLSYETSQSPDSLLKLTNQARQAFQAGSLAINQELSSAAQAKAKDMATRNYWSHVTPDGNEPWIFVANTGYQYQKLGENLAVGFADEQSVINGWMASAAHKENLIDPAYTDVGFGFANAENYTATGGGQMTIVVAFYGRPMSLSAPAPSSISTSKAPSTDNTLDSKVLSDTLVRSQVGLYKLGANSWGPAMVIVCIGGLAGMILSKHVRQLKRSIRKGERYVWRHPLVDLLVLVAIGLLVVLTQTAGYIQ